MAGPDAEGPFYVAQGPIVTSIHISSGHVLRQKFLPFRIGSLELAGSRLYAFGKKWIRPGRLGDKSHVSYCCGISLFGDAKNRGNNESLGDTENLVTAKLAPPQPNAGGVLFAVGGSGGSLAIVGADGNKKAGFSCSGCGEITAIGFSGVADCLAFGTSNGAMYKCEIVAGVEELNCVRLTFSAPPDVVDEVTGAIVITETDIGICMGEGKCAHRWHAAVRGTAFEKCAELENTPACRLLLAAETTAAAQCNPQVTGERVALTSSQGTASTRIAARLQGEQRIEERFLADAVRQEFRSPLVFLIDAVPADVARVDAANATALACSPIAVVWKHVSVPLPNWWDKVRPW